MVYKMIEIGEERTAYKKRVPICRIGEGSIIGEECLLDAHLYNYTVRVESSTLKVLSCKRSGGMKMFKKNMIFSNLEMIYKRKR